MKLLCYFDLPTLGGFFALSVLRHLPTTRWRGWLTAHEVGPSSPARAHTGSSTLNPPASSFRPPTFERLAKSDFLLHGRRSAKVIFPRQVQQLVCERHRTILVLTEIDTTLD